MLRKILLIFFLTISSHGNAWDFGEIESFACFRETSKVPVKVTITDNGDIDVTWDEYPVKYDFMFFSNGPDNIVGGTISRPPEPEMDTKLQRFFQGDRSANIVLRTDIVMFEMKTKKFFFGQVESGFTFQMNCISY